MTQINQYVALDSIATAALAQIRTSPLSQHVHVNRAPLAKLQHTTPATPTPTTASSNIEENEDYEAKIERLKKRRLQIAVASRRSRAKRKHEINLLKQENEMLWKENLVLTRRLRDLGEDIPEQDHKRQRQDPAQGSGEPTVVVKTDDTQPTVPTPHDRAGTSSPDSISLTHTSLTNAHQAPQATMESMKRFFRSRLNWYFAQLKSDSIAHFGQALPFHIKQQVAKLQVDLVGNNTPAPEQ